MCILAKLSTDQLCTTKHVRPLIVATKLQVTAVLLEQRIEIIALHDHVVELQEAKSLLHTLLVAFSRQHTIDREMRSNLTQYLYIIQIKQPVRIIYHKRFSL